MGLMAELGLIKSQNTKTGSIFEALVPDFFKLSAIRPSEYMAFCWTKYNDNYPNQDVGTNGKFFELCIATLLIRENILPFYMQAQMAFVPNVNYDFILYTNQGWPISLSAKTSLRERYKQADLEAIALKYVHRRSKSYLVTLNKKECIGIKNKIANGDVIGIDESVFALSSEFDDFIKLLKDNYCFYSPSPVEIIKAEILITCEKVKNVCSSHL